MGMRPGQAATLPPFEDVLRRYGPDVWRFAAAQAGPGQADDIFQETMLAALRSYPALREPGSVRSWLLRIAARKAVDAARVLARAPVPVPDPDPGPAAQAAAPDDGLWGELRALPAKQRQAVALRIVLDLPYGEIAAAMGTSTEAARRNVFEALRTLRRRIREVPADDRT
jgi:RNA polymerase sigma factor (sigma-70 family)